MKKSYSFLIILSLHDFIFCLLAKSHPAKKSCLHIFLKFLSFIYIIECDHHVISCFSIHVVHLSSYVDQLIKLGDLLFIILKVLPTVQPACQKDKRTPLLYNHSLLYLECLLSIVEDQSSILLFSQFMTFSPLLFLLPSQLKTLSPLLFQSKFSPKCCSGS